MKVFWALIAVLVAGTVALLASGVLSNNKPTESPAPVAHTPANPPAPQPPAPKPAEPNNVVALTQPLTATPPAAAPTPTETTTPRTQAAPADSTLDQTPVAAAPVDSPATPGAAAPAPVEAPAPQAKQPEPTAEHVAPADVAPAAPKAAEEPENQLIALQKEIAAQRAAEAAQKQAAKDAEKAAATNPASTPPPAPAAQSPATSDAPFAGAKVETKPDGSLLIDGKYTVKGKGTEAEPYKVTWDQLLSAQNEYAPKEGRKTIPPRIQALNDKWLDITGYVAFPLMTSESDELLSMMNQWDGCCIGVPPTPYDAVEVRLTSAVSGNARLTTYGSVKGKFKVDPHLVGGWLVGLYVMDQAKLTPVSYGGIAP